MILQDYMYIHVCTMKERKFAQSVGRIDLAIASQPLLSRISQNHLRSMINIKTCFDILRDICGGKHSASNGICLTCDWHMYMYMMSVFHCQLLYNSGSSK